MKVLGIDPGLASTGFGAIAYAGSTPSLLKCGSIKTAKTDHISQRLFQIYSDICLLIKTLEPDLVAVENIFSLVRYPKAGILLGGVMGIIYLTIVQNGLTLIEISPKEIKNALVGYGSADKKQVRNTVQALLRIDGISSFHAADALAVALTAFYRSNTRGCA
ncbi:MAG: crossover junction endodeoxyribonuclease RuvC [Syntrophus sp. (in: bacteria)]|nr:crossover junction endodeoxyribonuclease RuvC [Syntrophus sp. (in: bacteria)]